MRHSALVFVVLVTGWAALAQAAPWSVQTTGDTVAVEADNAVMSQVLADFSAKTGVRFVVPKAIGEARISVGFRPVDTETAVKKLLKGHNFISEYDPEGRLEKVTVCGGTGLTTIGSRAPAPAADLLPQPNDPPPPEPETAPEPEPAAEPDDTSGTKGRAVTRRRYEGEGIAPGRAAAIVRHQDGTVSEVEVKTGFHSGRP